MNNNPAIRMGARVARTVYFEDQIPVTVPTDNIVLWLYEQAAPSLQTGYLLAHALDGVIWGRIAASRLTTGDQIKGDITAVLHNDTLQEVRIFNDAVEWHLWRAEDRWQLCVTQDQPESTPDDLARAFDEYHVLWGTYAAWRGDGFTLVEEGMQGLRHLLPLALSSAFPQTRSEGENYTRRRVCLRVRHYLGAVDRSGAHVIIRSRLVDLEEVTYATQPTE